LVSEKNTYGWHPKGEHIADIVTDQYDLVYVVMKPAIVVRSHDPGSLEATYRIMGYSETEKKKYRTYAERHLPQEHFTMAECTGLDRHVMILAGETLA